MVTTLLSVSPFAVLVADDTAGVHTVNQRWVDLSGLAPGKSLGHGWLATVEAASRDSLRDDVVGVARGGAGRRRDYRLVGPNGPRWVRWWIDRHEIDGSPKVVLTALDIHDDQSQQADLYHLATHDSLTGLSNRRFFTENVEHALRRAQRSGQPVCLLYIDLDGFKQINDSAGHTVGDRVLAAVAGRLRSAVRASDSVARLGGDEFAVLVEGLTGDQDSKTVRDRVESALEVTIQLDGRAWPVSASVGAVVSRGEAASAGELFERADQAMYEAKRVRACAGGGGTPAPGALAGRTLAGAPAPGRLAGKTLAGRTLAARRSGGSCAGCFRAERPAPARLLSTRACQAIVRD
jgi:diguanylate cyclase (GGDEF)-like protein